MLAQHAQPKLRNTRNPKHNKLSAEDCATIRRRVQSGELQMDVAADFHVSAGYVSLIVSGRVRREIGLLDKQEHVYIYGDTGEQIAVVESEEDAALTSVEIRKANLLVMRRALEKRIREINNELADLDGLPF
jgi:hypothetical protein